MGHRYSLLKIFCGVLLMLFFSLVGYWVCSYIGLRDSQKEIVQMHTNHISSIDSLFCDIKKNILQENKKTEAAVLHLVDSIAGKRTINSKRINRTLIVALQDLLKANNAQLLASQFKKDSILCQHENLIAQEQIKQILSLHIDKIDNDYSIVGIWGAVLSILFIAFGFFGIFKIEETKAEVNKILSEVKEQGATSVKDIESKSQSLQNMLTNFDDQLNSMLQESKRQAQNVKKLRDKYLMELEKFEQKAIDIDSKIEQYQKDLMSQSIEYMKQKEDYFSMAEQRIEDIIKEYQQKSMDMDSRKEDNHG